MSYGIFNSARVALQYEGLIAMAQRTPGGEQGGMYEIFGGKIEPGETPFAAAVREVREEVGRDVDFLTLEPRECKPYEITSGKHVSRMCRVFAFIATPDSMNIHLNPAEHIPGSEVWLSLQEIDNMPRGLMTPATSIAINGLGAVLR